MSTTTGRLVEASLFVFGPLHVQVRNSLFPKQTVLYFPLFHLLIHSCVRGFQPRSRVGCLAILCRSCVVGLLSILPHFCVAPLANVYPEPPPTVASPLLVSERTLVKTEGIETDLFEKLVLCCFCFKVKLLILIPPGAGEAQANGRMRKRRRAAEGMYVKLYQGKKALVW